MHRTWPPLLLLLALAVLPPTAASSGTTGSCSDGGVVSTGLALPDAAQVCESRGGSLCRLTIDADCTLEEVEAAQCVKICMDGSIVGAEGTSSDMRRFAVFVEAGFEIVSLDLVTDLGVCALNFPSAISSGSLSAHVGLSSSDGTLQPATAFDFCLIAPACPDPDTRSGSCGDTGGSFCFPSPCLDVGGGCYVCGQECGDLDGVPGLCEEGSCGLDAECIDQEDGCYVCVDSLACPDPYAFLGICEEGSCGLDDECIDQEDGCYVCNPITSDACDEINEFSGSCEDEGAPSKCTLDDVCIDLINGCYMCDVGGADPCEQFGATSGTCELEGFFNCSAGCRSLLDGCYECIDPCEEIGGFSGTCQEYDFVCDSYSEPCQDLEGGCFICGSGGGAHGDPHMTGFDNSQFDYNGEMGAVFDVVSTPAFQVNALLMPEMDNGLTYVGAVGIVTAGGDHAAVRAAVVEDRLVVEVNDAVVDLQSAGEVAAGDITLQAHSNGDVKVTLPGLVLVVEVHRKIFLNIKNARLTQAHTHIGGVLGETAHANRSVSAGLSHEDSYYFVDSLTTHSMAAAKAAVVESRKMGSFYDASAVLGEAAMEHL